MSVIFMEVSNMDLGVGSMRLNLQGIGCYLLVVQKSELPQTQLANVRTMNMLVEGNFWPRKHRDSDPSVRMVGSHHILSTGKLSGLAHCR